MLLADCEQALGNHELGTKYLREAIAEHEQGGDLTAQWTGWNKLAHAYQGERRLSEALDACNHAMGISPRLGVKRNAKSATMLELLASLQQDLDDWSAAEATRRKIISLQLAGGT